ncbi:hypothetical protein GYA27_01820 [candidate division WWE3 bacterium]|uniref:Uncharacterized protein n=1 Tax=candidate division WWE3 bacterium TaxID=2053526 RepID=A0A7X9DKK3_UNCKA|nr:hypothetical protein [candidate division WWE3 bacterium]
MSSKFAGMVILSSIVFMYVLISPFISNLEYKNLENKGMACDARLTNACFLSIDALCFEYVSPCTIPEGWYVKRTASNVFYLEE